MRRLFAILAPWLAFGCAAVAGFEQIVYENGDAGMDGGGAEDATTDVASPPADGAGGTDAGPDTRSPDPVGCSASGMHDFCDDFAQPTVFGDGGWTANDMTGGTLTRVDDSILSTLPDDQAGGEVYDVLTIDRPWIPVNGLRPRVAAFVKMKVEQCVANYARPFSYFAGSVMRRYYGSVEITTDRGKCYVSLAVREIYADAAQTGLNQLQEEVTVGAWHDMAILVDELAGGKTKITFDLDGHASGIVIQAIANDDDFTMQIGLAGQRGGGRIRYDDFRFDWLPK